MNPDITGRMRDAVAVSLPEVQRGRIPLAGIIADLYVSLYIQTA